MTVFTEWWTNIRKATTNSSVLSDPAVAIKDFLSEGAIDVSSCQYGVGVEVAAEMIDQTKYALIFENHKDAPPRSPCKKLAAEMRDFRFDGLKEIMSLDLHPEETQSLIRQQKNTLLAIAVAATTIENCEDSVSFVKSFRERPLK